jgi:hypothetical protein
MEVVLPRLAKRLHRDIQRYREGELNDAQFTRSFEGVLQRQYSWLAQRGVPEAEAAVVIHGAVLVLSGPGLRAEAAELGEPLEMVEYRAVRAAASDVSRNYEVDERLTLRQISAVVARYAE